MNAFLTILGVTIATMAIFTITIGAWAIGLAELFRMLLS